MKYEEKLLTYLVENYRKSKKDSGTNKSNRRTQVQPEKFYHKYHENDGDFEEISKFDRVVSDLTAKGFVTSDSETFGTRIQCVYLVDERIEEIEQYLSNQYGYLPKDTQLQKLQALIDRYQKASSICAQECGLLATCLAQRKLPKNLDSLDAVLKAVSFIENNREDLYLREASMKIYGDSKFFETETLQPVCKLIRKYADQPRGTNQLRDEILLDYHIAKEPQKLCIKGNAILTIADKSVDISGFSEGIEFLVPDLARITSIQILAPAFMTIENRTSYLRYQAEDLVLFYLGGYANRDQRDFIKLVHRFNPDVQYKHFGDLDAGGFWIHQTLCAATGVAFSLHCMSVDELKNPAYQSCLHPLTPQDVIRLQKLKKMAAYQTVVDYMITHKVKLEQEIVSLQLMKNTEERSQRD